MTQDEAKFALTKLGFVDVEIEKAGGFYAVSAAIDDGGGNRRIGVVHTSIDDAALMLANRGFDAILYARYRKALDEAKPAALGEPGEGLGDAGDNKLTEELANAGGAQSPPPPPPAQQPPATTDETEGEGGGK